MRTEEKWNDNLDKINLETEDRCYAEGRWAAVQEEISSNSLPDDFLLDEVRCGFMVPAAVKQAWAAELKVLSEIDRVCRRHDIRYFADWGTLIGAVRHGGIIPWDDDLDILMKREDYIKFLEVAPSELPEGFHVQTYRNQKDYWLFMGKVVGRNQICFEKEHLRNFYNYPYIACVDIFVLDHIFRDPQKEEERCRKCLQLLAVADGIVEGTIDRSRWEYHFQELESLGIGIPRSDDAVAVGRYLYGEVEKLFALVPPQESDMLGQLFPWGLKNKGPYYPKEYYENAVELPFEYMTIPVPTAYDRMLRQRYGEYWRLVKNAGAHDYPLFEGQKNNLRKVLDFDLPEFKCSTEKLKSVLGRDKAESASSHKALAKLCLKEMEKLQEMIFSLYGYAEKPLVSQEVDGGRNAKTDDAKFFGSQEAGTGQEAGDFGPALVQESGGMEALAGQLQQWAVDLGTMIEQVKGEGHALIPLLEKYCELVYQYAVGAGDTMQDNPSSEAGAAALALGQKPSSEDKGFEGKPEAEESGNRQMQPAEDEGFAGKSRAEGSASRQKPRSDEKGFDGEKRTNAMGEILEHIQVCAQEEVISRETVLFLPVHRKDWKYILPFVRSWSAKKNADVYICVLPYYYKDYDGTPKMMCSEADDFMEIKNTIQAPSLHLLDAAQVTREFLELLHPDHIYIQNPYDAWHPAISVPDTFYAENLYKVTDDLVYVPPYETEDFTEENQRAHHNLNYYVRVPGVAYADKVYVPNENHKKAYADSLTQWLGKASAEVWEQKLEILPEWKQKLAAKGQTADKKLPERNAAVKDSFSAMGQGDSEASDGAVSALGRRKRLLYCISYGAWYEYRETAVEKFESAAGTFKEASGIEVVVAIYPSGEKAGEIRLPDFLRDRLVPYEEAERQSFDAYYGDVSPMVVNFMKKIPIMIQNWEC